MEDFLNNIIERYWLKYQSIPFVFVLFSAFCLTCVSDDAQMSHVKLYIALGICIPLLLAYIIACIVHNRIPRAKQANNSVLFVIDAESSQLYKDVQVKLVQSFTDIMNCNALGTSFVALCLSREKVKKYNHKSKAGATKLLEKVNCIFLVDVRYRVDDVSNAEDFELSINYGVIHKQFEHTVDMMLQIDMNILSESIKKRRFNRQNTLDEFSFTAEALSYICEYIIALVYLFSGNYMQSRSLFYDLRIRLLGRHREGLVPNLLSLTEKRLYASCINIATDCAADFYRAKSTDSINQMEKYLDEANHLFPNTYEYHLNKAYCLIASKYDDAEARKHIILCKKMKPKGDWRYSEAFLDAFSGRSPLSVYKKYRRAFEIDSEDILQIIDYTEYILEKCPERTGLIFACALLYDYIGDRIIAKEYLERYQQIPESCKVADIIHHILSERSN